jgi:hypothetical protein
MFTPRSFYKEITLQINQEHPCHTRVLLEFLMLLKGLSG